MHVAEGTSTVILLAVVVTLCTICDGRISTNLWRPIGLELGPRNGVPTSRSGKCLLNETYYIEQKVDHYGFANDDTFKMRYLVAKQYWDPKGGPIFFYTGNEADIVLFCENTGFIWDIAPEFKAMVVFAEHRYYGDSLPYGKDSYKDKEHLAYLTSEQALADYAVLIKYLKANITGAAHSPVVAFGGSYGGMLAAWMRMKYPDAVVGAIAASAPIWSLNNLTNCNAQFRIITKDFSEVSSTCSQNIRAVWATVDKYRYTLTGREQLQKSFRLCNYKDTYNAAGIKNWLTGTFFNLAMVDYPYPTSFLAPLPAFPIEVVCSHIKTPNASGDVLLDEIGKAINVYYNYTGQATCFNITASGNLGYKGWGYQFCTEMAMPTCTDGVHDMFEPSPWFYDAFVKHCQMEYGVTPRPDWAIVQYWGKNIASASNIVFSNGLLDPWSAGGVLKSISDSLVAVIIPEGAHHLDLRSKNKADPPSVVQARNTEKSYIKKWIAKK